MFTDASGSKTQLSHMLLPTLLLCTFTGFSVLVVISTLLVDIAESFQVSIGTASQLGLISSIIGIIVGVVMSTVSIRFKNKSIFLLAISLFTAGALGYFVAQDFGVLVFAQFLTATGSSVIFILTYTLIGDYLPIEKRGWAIGLIVSSGLLSFIIIAPLSGLIAGIAGWRFVFLWFTIPFSFSCLALSLFSIPSKQSKLETTGQSLYKLALKKVFLCRSAFACLASTTLVMFIASVPIYAVSYYRVSYSVSPTIGGILISVTGIGGILSGLVGGRHVNKFGRKRMAVVFYIVSGCACILFTFIPLMWLSVVVWTIAAGASTVGMISLNSLTLEQVPRFRGSMMSITASFQNLGTGLGVIVGGLILNSFSNNFQLLMVVLGSLGACTSLVLLLFAKDPCKADGLA